MARPPAQDVTDAELAVLQVLWDRGPAPIRAITEAVYGGGGASRYATVQKLLERLERKGFVGRDRADAVHTFAAAVDRDALIGRRLRAVAETLCDGSLTPILTHLVRAERLNEAERRALRALVDELGAEPQRPSPDAPRGGRGR